jgi:alginate O-acetyltransferase complex protein AlgI
VAANLALLVVFKYGALVTRLVTSDEGGLAALLLHIPLPIGISFYTFEGISLLVDTLRQERDAEAGRPRQGWAIERRFVSHVERTAFFVAFFPHLIAGPVLKARSFFPQIGPRSLAQIRWEPALRALLTGYFLKMFVADNLHDYTFWLTFPYFQAQSAATNLVLLFGYSIQIFADFAGYSLIAIGLAALLGYDLMQNFNFPYLSRTLAEFWRRWHISLSTWLRDYLYIPLGGSRRGELRTYVNLMIVMILGGLWHGSTWSYAVWGLFHGLGLAAERALRLDDPPSRARGMLTVLRVLSTFTFVSIGWIFFKLPDFGQALAFFGSLAANFGQPLEGAKAVPVLIYAAPAVAYHLLNLHTLDPAAPPEPRPLAARLRPIAYGCMLALLLLNAGSSEAFIYFQF